MTKTRIHPGPGPASGAVSTLPNYYDATAGMYDVLRTEKAGKDYAAEAGRVSELIRSACPHAVTLLDVACGTGLHLEHFRRSFTCTGIDLSAPMLGVAAGRLPDVALHQADMMDFQLPQRFDAITCLFGSIAYGRTVENLHRAVARMAAHLAPAGVLIVEPWYQPDTFHPHTWSTLLDRDDARIVEVGRSWKEGPRSYFESQFLTCTEAGIEHLSVLEEQGLFRWAEYSAAMRSAGLASSSLDEPGRWQNRGIFVAKREFQ